MDDPQSKVLTTEDLYDTVRGQTLESIPAELAGTFDGTLRFQEPEFQDGLNFTARNGRKWAGRVEEGSRVMVACPTGDDWKVLDVAAVEEVFLAEFSDLPDRYVEMHHNLDSRAELAEVMEGIYGEDFSTGSLITGVVFQLLDD